MIDEHISETIGIYGNDSGGRYYGSLSLGICYDGDYWLFTPIEEHSFSSFELREIADYMDNKPLPKGAKPL